MSEQLDQLARIEKRMSKRPWAEYGDQCIYAGRKKVRGSHVVRTALRADASGIAALRNCAHPLIEIAQSVRRQHRPRKDGRCRCDIGQAGGLCPDMELADRLDERLTEVLGERDA